MRIVIGDTSAAFLQQLQDRESRRLSRIIHIFFVRDAENANLAALERLAKVIERQPNALDDILRHGGVNLAGQLDETGMQVKLAGHPGQIKRIDGNTMSAQSRTRIKSLKAERLGL